MSTWVYGSGLVLVALVLSGFYPTTGSEPLPTTPSEAEAFVSKMVEYWAGQVPDKVSCAPAIKEAGAYYFECDVSKSGQGDRLFFVMKR